MGLVEDSQLVRKAIEGSEQIMGNLRIYSESDLYVCKLPVIGAGTANVLYRVGRLDSGLWVATRENIIFPDGELQRNVGENYARRLEFILAQGDTASRFCVGLRMDIGVPENEDDRYVLLLEDLTEGGSKTITPEPDTEFGWRDGKKVYFDFRDDCRLFDEPKFMRDELMMHIK